MLDLFIIVVLLWAAWRGWRAGLVKEVVSAVGFFVGLFIAALLYEWLGSYLAVSGTETNMVTSLIAFFLLWIVVPIVLGMVANVLTRFLKGMKLGTPNSILGALVGVFKFWVLLCCVLYAMGALRILNADRVADSHLYGILMAPAHAFVHGDTPESQPADSVSDAKPDTVWVPIHHPANGGNQRDAQSAH